MTLGWSHIVILCLAVVYLLMRFLSEKPFIKNYQHLLKVIFFGCLAVFLIVQFFQNGQYWGVLPVLMGSLAFAKYYYDMNLASREDESSNED